MVSFESCFTTQIEPLSEEDLVINDFQEGRQRVDLVASRIFSEYSTARQLKEVAFSCGFEFLSDSEKIRFFYLFDKEFDPYNRRRSEASQTCYFDLTIAKKEDLEAFQGFHLIIQRLLKVETAFFRSHLQIQKLTSSAICAVRSYMNQEILQFNLKKSQDSFEGAGKSSIDKVEWEAYEVARRAEELYRSDIPT